MPSAQTYKNKNILNNLYSPTLAFFLYKYRLFCKKRGLGQSPALIIPLTKEAFPESLFFCPDSYPRSFFAPSAAELFAADSADRLRKERGDTKVRPDGFIDKKKGKYIIVYSIFIIHAPIPLLCEERKQETKIQNQAASADSCAILKHDSQAVSWQKACIFGEIRLE